MDVVKALMKYPGSKWRIAKWIIDFFPDHHSYLEPFFGSGAILFNKTRSSIETVNDLDGNVINLFEWIKKDPERLAHEIYYTPYAREVYENAYSSEPEDSLGRAVNFYIRINMGYGFKTNGEKTGWKNDVQGREYAYTAREWCNFPEKIMQAAERLRGVQIECMPAVDLIQRFNYRNVLIYLDPPYLLSTRCGKLYQCEMNDAGHGELLDVALVHKGPVIISGYDNALYNDRLRNWHKEEIECYSRALSKKTEVIWMNYDPVRQMELELTD